MKNHPSKMLKYKEQKFSTEYRLGAMHIGDTPIKERICKMTAIQAQALNSQFKNSGVKYTLLQEEKAVEAKVEATQTEDKPKRTRRTKEQIEAENKK